MAKIDPRSLTIDAKALRTLTIQDRLAFFRTSEGQSYLASLSPIEYNQLISSYHKKQLAPLTGAARAPSGGGTATPVLSGAPSRPSPTRPTPSTPSAIPVPPSAPGRPQQQVRPSGTTPSVGQDTRFAWERRLEELAGRKGSQQQQQSVSGFSRQKFEQMFKGTSLSNQYDAVLSAAQKHNMNPALVAAIMAHETGRGKNLRGNNPAGIMDPSKNWKVKKQYESLEQGIDDAVKTMKRNFDRGGGTVEGMAKIYAPPGAANDPRGLNQYWPSGASKFMKQLGEEAPTVSPGVSKEDAAKTGTGGFVSKPKTTKDVTEENSKQIIKEFAEGNKVLGQRILDKALEIEGLHEKKDRDAIRNYLNSGGRRGVDPAVTPWCADFVNATLKNFNIKGTGSAVATSFSKWGVEVKSDKIQAGDVVVQHRGRAAGAPGGHVAFATGRTKTDKNGNLLIEMYGGNQSNRATKKWINVNSVYIRRAPEVANGEQNAPQGFDQTKIEKVNPPKGYENLPEDIRNQIESLPEHRRYEAYKNLQAIQDQGRNFVDEFSQEYQKLIDSGQTVTQAAAATASAAESITPKEIPQFKIWQENEKINTVPTSEERQKVFEQGGVVVNLDTNWSKRGRQTGPLVVIPDNATDEQRKAAQDYVREIEKVYTEKFGKSLPGKVLTRSENKRGRTATMHTEPFSINDDKAVDYFTKTEEGRNVLANITAKTLGTIPNVQFSEPHNIYQPKKPDVGAVSERDRSINEVGVAKILIQDLQRIRKEQQEKLTQTQQSPVVPVQSTQVSVSSDIPPAAPQTGVPVSPGTPSDAPQSTGSGGFVSVPTRSSSPTAPAVTPAPAAPEPRSSSPTAPAVTPAPAAPEPRSSSPTAPAVTPAPAAPAPESMPVPEIPTAEPTTEKPPPTYEDGGEQQFAGENLAIVDRDTSEVKALMNDTERIEVTPSSRENSVGIEDRTQQLIAQEQTVADQQSDQLEMPMETRMTQYYDSGYNQEWQSMMQEVKEASSQIYKSPTAARAYDAHRFASTGDVFKHFAYKTPTLKF